MFSKQTVRKLTDADRYPKQSLSLVQDSEVCDKNVSNKGEANQRVTEKGSLVKYIDDLNVHMNLWPSQPYMLCFLKSRDFSNKCILLTSYSFTAFLSEMFYLNRSIIYFAINSSFVYSSCCRPESSQNLSLIFGVLAQTLQCLHGSFLLVILPQRNKHPHHR